MSNPEQPSFANDNWFEKVEPYQTRVRAVALFTLVGWTVLFTVALFTPKAIATWFIGCFFAGPLAVWLSPRSRRAWGSRYALICLAWPITLPASVISMIRHRKHRHWRARNASELARHVRSGP